MESEKTMNQYFRSLNTPLPEDIAALKAAGYYEAAIDFINMRLAEDWSARQNSLEYQGLTPFGVACETSSIKTMPAAMRESMLVQREIMRLLPLYYSYTEEEAFSLLSDKIADFTEDEFHTLFDENRLDWHFVNGAPYISNEFYDSLIDTDASYAARAGVPHTGVRNAQRDAVILQMQQNGSVTMQFTLSASIKANEQAFARALAEAKANGNDTVFVRAWLPIPAACDSQSEIALQTSVPKKPTYVAAENVAARSVYWEFEATENPQFEITYQYQQTAVYHKLPTVVQGQDGQKNVSASASIHAPYGNEVLPEDLAEQEPHLCFTPYLCALVQELTEGLVSPLEKARAIYDYITFHVHYRYMPPYFTLEKIAENCAVSRRGDCGVMASCFITMCRIANIPARWESGLMVYPEKAGCHDWARFYIAPYGWLYADCSFGSAAAREEAEERRTHYFGNLDPYRMVANNTFFAPLTPPKEGWRADPYDNQCGELEFNGIGVLGIELDTKVEVISADTI